MIPHGGAAVRLRGARSSPTAPNGSMRSGSRNAVAGSRASGRRLVRRRRPARAQATRPAAARAECGSAGTHRPTRCSWCGIRSRRGAVVRPGRSERGRHRPKRARPSALDRRARPLHATRGTTPMRHPRGQALFVAASAILAAGWVAAACVRPAPPVPSAAGPSGTAGQARADSALRITLQRGPCFGTCPVYSVTLDSSGAVLFEGRRFVADTGISTGSVPRPRIDSLVAELDRGWVLRLLRPLRRRRARL